ncbi:hypothetical protein [Ferirhizobium litorale]|uniref:hypothetical protein n=1 Tax=Ferirhizobium litorale TaxID=2927786 RepID=UPI0028931412|nr:hypothetical protein [Fererhizobium litorale]
MNLLRSDAGFDLLQNIMAGSGTRWWKEFEPGVQLADLKARMEWQFEQIERLKKEMGK